MTTEVQIALQPVAGQDPAAALTAAAAKLARQSLEMLVQQAGQPLTGRIVPPPPNLPAGMAQIAVADLVLTLKLSLPLPPGTPVRIDVQQVPNGQPVVTVQPAPPPPPQAAPTAALPRSVPAPQTPTQQVPLPAVAAPQQQTPAPAQRTPPALATAPTAPPAAAQVQPPPAPVVTVPQPQSGTRVAPPASPPAGAVTTTQQAMPSPPLAPPASPPPAATGATPAPPQPPAPVAPAATATTQAATPLPPSQPVAPQLSPAPPAPASLPAAGPLSPPSPTQPPAPAIPPAPAPAAAPTVATASTIAAAPAAASQSARPPAPALAAAPAPAAAAIATPAPPQPQLLLQRLAQAFAQPATPVPAAPPVPGTPAQLVLAATTQAAAQQQSAAPLLQSLAATLPQLPPPVAEAAARVLATRLNLDRGAPAGEALKQAVLKSGVFLDAPAKVGGQPDLRQALGQLRGTLLAWLGDEIAPVAAITRRPVPPPPAKGAVPRGQAPEPSPPLHADAREAGKSLLGQTEGALSRLKLMQWSTQPADAARPGLATGAPTEWNLELPVMLGHELAMAQLQIGRDGKAKADPKDKAWRLRFALKFSLLGEVGAQVSMLGRRTSVAVWADEEATAEALEAMLPELGAALAARDLDLVSLTVRRGPPRDEALPAGRLMDSLT